ncbi:MAG: hypothetical protein QOD99_1994 [Chthoniobacter sp.]|jgi:hypothetical protein|nr:hypothetical protein [Chthoniobacter sp.]
MPPLLKISENELPAARLLNSAASFGKRSHASAPPPDAALRKTIFGLNHSSVIYGGIAIAALVILPLGGIAVRARIRALHAQVEPSPIPAAVVAPVKPFVAPTPVPVKKIPMPVVKPGTFEVTSIMTGGPTGIAVINGREHVKGDEVPVAGEPGWKVEEIHENGVTLNYFGNLLVVELEAEGATKPLNDKLRPLD